jgi:uncharacterized membrane protein
VPEQDFWSLPIHPAIVHFPVAMLTTSWFLTIIGHMTYPARGLGLSRSLEWIGVLFLPFAIASGFRDAGLDFLTQPQWNQPLIWHFLGTMVSAALFATHAAWRHKVGGRRALAAPWIDLGLSSAGFWFLLLAGLIAGEMVFG